MSLNKLITTSILSICVFASLWGSAYATLLPNPITTTILTPTSTQLVGTTINTHFTIYDTSKDYYVHGIVYFDLTPIGAFGCGSPDDPRIIFFRMACDSGIVPFTAPYIGGVHVLMIKMSDQLGNTAQATVVIYQ